MKVNYTRCLIRGNPCLVALDYGSNNNVVSQRLVEKLELRISFHLNQAWIKFSKGQCVKELLCDIALIDSFHPLLVCGWLRFRTLDLDEHYLYLSHEGHKMKLKFMTPRQVSKDQHRLKDTVCDVILQDQKDKQMDETHQLPCLKRKLVHIAFIKRLVHW